jgi:hypothetical protein
MRSARDSLSARMDAWHSIQLWNINFLQNKVKLMCATGGRQEFMEDSPAA